MRSSASTSSVAATREMEARVLQQEIIRLDAAIKQRLAGFIEAAVSDRALLEETKTAKALIADLKRKISTLQMVADRLDPRTSVAVTASDVEKHSRELEEDERLLRLHCVRAKKNIQDAARIELMSGGEEGGIGLRRRKFEEESKREGAAKTTARLASLVARANDQLKKSEDTTYKLYTSSTVLADAQNEFVNQQAHIQTGSKLLSKYERRELTDKILIAIALLFYVLVLWYILQKRVLMKFWLW